MSIEFHSSVQTWTRDQLVDALTQLYADAGFVVNTMTSRSDCVAFVARQRSGEEGAGIAVGCMVDDEMPIVFQAEVLEFCRNIETCGCSSGELITTGKFERLAVEAAKDFPVRLVDGKALQKVINDRQPDVEPPLRHTIQVNPVALEMARARIENANARLATIRGTEQPGIRTLTAPETASAERSEALAKALNYRPKAPAAKRFDLSERKTLALVTVGATLVLGLLFAVSYPRTTVDAADQFREVLTGDAVPSVETPISTKERSDAKNDLLEGYALSSEAASSAEPDIFTLRRKLVHRVDLLEDLKHREEYEPLAAKLVAFVHAAKNVGLDYAKMGVYQLRETVQFASEAAGLEKMEAPQMRGLRALKLSEEDQERILPYLSISDYELKLRSHPIAVNELLASDGDGFSTVRYGASLEKLERRLWAESVMDSRRYAQAIVAITNAALIAGVDMVQECEGDLDALILSLTEGREIQDKSNPLYGHTFKVYAPPPDDLGVVKRFLQVRNDQLYYHEQLEDLDVPPVHFTEPGEETAKKAIGLAEDLIRKTARQILVNSASYQRSLVPVVSS